MCESFKLFKELYNTIKGKYADVCRYDKLIKYEND